MSLGPLSMPCSITTERGRGLGTGFETDADRGTGAGWSAGLDSSVALTGDWVEFLPESRDVSFATICCLSLSPSNREEKIRKGMLSCFVKNLKS